MPLSQSIIRSIANFVVAWLLSLPVINALDVDQALWQTLTMAVVGTVYYVVVRFLETHVSGKFSLLLASTKQPTRYLASDVAVSQRKAI